VDRFVEQARRFAESGSDPVAPRLAATVVLLRPPFQVYLVRRAASLAFAAGMYAFPGGTVDPIDYADPLAGDWPAWLGRSPADANAVVRAAVREVAEETGVRLAAGDLVPWSRWITPEFEPRRYDTSFFLARLPDGERPADPSGEADRAEWVRPSGAVARFDSGDLGMLPPTITTLRELAAFDSVAAALAAIRDAATPIEPRLEQTPDGTARFVIPL
jgi:8-oxo-dGTP pyrophosphatase MutT (NUDIX family)